MSEKRRFAFVYSFIHSFNSFNESIGASLVAQMVKNLPANAGDPGSISGSGRSPGEGNSNPLQYSCLENSMKEKGYSPWGRKQSDMTGQLTHTQRMNIRAVECVSKQSRQ